CVWLERMWTLRLLSGAGLLRPPARLLCATSYLHRAAIRVRALQVLSRPILRRPPEGWIWRLERLWSSRLLRWPTRLCSRRTLPRMGWPRGAPVVIRLMSKREMLAPLPVILLSTDATFA